MATLTGGKTPAISSPQPSGGRPDGAWPDGRHRSARRRRRFLVPLAMVALGIALLVAVLLITASGQSPPATGAAKLVPGDALLYVHVSTDRRRPAVRRAVKLAQRLPGWSRLGDALARRAGVPVTAPWVGKEAAFALLDTTGSSAGSLIVLDVRNRAQASAYLAAAPALPDGSYRGIPLLRERSGTVFAFARHYLLLGQAASVRAALDVSRGGAQSLAATPAYQQAAAGEPDDRALDVYAPVGGLRRLLEPRGGLVGALGGLLDRSTLSGVAISASAVGGGLRLRIHEALYQALGQVNRRPLQFTPTLADVLPSGSTLLLDVHGLSRAAPPILAAAATAGIGGRIGPLLSRLGGALAAEGVDVAQVLSIFSGETALAITPSGRRDGRPALVIVARTAHPDSTRALLAGLEAPLEQLFPPPSSGAGQAPVFNDIPVAGTTVHQFALGPGLQLDWAVFRGLVVLSTSVRAIEGIASHRAALSDTRPFHATLGDHPDQVTSLLFFDFHQLLAIGEQAGLMRGAQLGALRPDLERIRAVGLASTSGESDTTSEMFLQIP